MRNTSNSDDLKGICFSYFKMDINEYGLSFKYFQLHGKLTVPHAAWWRCTETSKLNFPNFQQSAFEMNVKSKFM